MRLLLCAAAPLCLFAAQAHAQTQAQETQTATGTCTASEKIDEVLRDKIGAVRTRTANCDTMVNVVGKSVTYSRKGAPQERVTFTGAIDSEGDLAVETITLGTAPAIRVDMGFCNGGPIGTDGDLAMVCSAVYMQGNEKIGISVVFQGKPTH